MTPITRTPTESSSPGRVAFRLVEHNHEAMTQVAWSASAPDVVSDLLLEEPIDYEAGARALKGFPLLEEDDFPAGGPFGA